MFDTDLSVADIDSTASYLARSPTTPESWKGSPKVNLPSRQWFSKVNDRVLTRLLYSWTPSCTLALVSSLVTVGCCLDTASVGLLAGRKAVFVVISVSLNLTPSPVCAGSTGYTGRRLPAPA